MIDHLPRSTTSRSNIPREISSNIRDVHPISPETRDWLTASSNNMFARSETSPTLINFILVRELLVTWRVIANLWRVKYVITSTLQVPFTIWRLHFKPKFLRIPEAILRTTFICLCFFFEDARHQRNLFKDYIASLCKNLANTKASTIANRPIPIFNHIRVHLPLIFVAINAWGTAQPYLSLPRLLNSSELHVPFARKSSSAVG